MLNGYHCPLIQGIWNRWDTEADNLFWLKFSIEEYYKA